MITYLLQASFILAALLAFYKLFLEKESFFSSNRFYLMAGLLLAFGLPFLEVPQLTENQGIVSEAIDRISSGGVNNRVETNTGISDFSGTTSEIPNTGSHGIFFWLIGIYFFGVVVLLLNLIFQIGSLLYKVFKTTDRLEDDSCIIVNSSSFKEPCSFLHFILINPANYDFETYQQIIAHEKTHVKNGHSLDLLCSEIAVIFLWFNPFIWIYRKEVEKNIEYQTDHLLVEKKAVKKEAYQMNLLKVATYNRPLSVTTNYNQSLLKQRIMKMNSKKSNPFSHWKYAFILPVLLLTVLVINKPLESLAQSEAGSSEAFKNEIKTALASPELPEVNLNLFADQGCQNLLRAVKNNDLEAAGKYLKSTSPNCTYRQDGEPRSPLVAAARNGNFEMGKLLIEHQADVEYHAWGDESPLMAVSRGGSLPFALLLLENGADVNKEVRGDGTALIYAVRANRFEIAKLLLEAGADPYQEVPGDEYAMYHARTSGNKDMIDLLKSYEK